MKRAWLGVLVAVSSCSSNTLDPYPEAVFVVDTDMAVPHFVDRLRVDTYTVDGTWIDSHDYAVVNPRDWPVSFGVYSEDLSNETALVVRLRAYTDSRTRDYRGERYADAFGATPGPIPPVSAQLPRLVLNGTDATPAQEPEPTTTIDRLVEVLLRPGQVGTISIVLRGDCMGTMARLSPASYQNVVISKAQTCIDTSNAKVGVVESPIGPAPPAGSLQGTWNQATPCNGSGPGSVCLPGGAFFLGSTDVLGADGSGTIVPTLPERAVGVSPFRIDANEVSVAQWRAAVAKGFQSPDETPWPSDTDYPANPTIDLDGCTYSTSPRSSPSRENYPINCVTFDAARAYCKSVGGDLPTEAQWEYAATSAGRDSEVRYVWDTSGGGGYPTCAQSVYGRSVSDGECVSVGWGPQPLMTATGMGQDITPLMIMNLGGSVVEWTLDTKAAYSDPCWTLAAPKDPTCQVPGQSHMGRGSSWSDRETPLGNRVAAPNLAYYADTYGFRCVYKSSP